MVIVDDVLIVDVVELIGGSMKVTFCTSFSCALDISDEKIRDKTVKKSIFLMICESRGLALQQFILVYLRIIGTD